MALASLLITMCIGHISSTNMTLMLQPEVWQQMYAHSPRGLQNVHGASRAGAHPTAQTAAGTPAVISRPAFPAPQRWSSAKPETYRLKAFTYRSRPRFVREPWTCLFVRN